MRIAPEGRPWIAGALVFAVLAWWAAGIWIALVFVLAAGFFANFFRDPARTPAGEGLVAPADGKVVRADDGRVDIFMNVLDVHVIRAPAAGRILSMRHVPGRFGHAEREPASLHNERLEIVLATEQGEIRLHLIAGLVARRIVPYVAVGDRVERAARIGIILFGSRVDCFFPKGYKTEVAVGAHVRAGESVIASLEKAGDDNA